MQVPKAAKQINSSSIEIRKKKKKKAFEMKLTRVLRDSNTSAIEIAIPRVLACKLVEEIHGIRGM